MTVSLPLMTPSHPKWKKFMVEMEGPNGCHFRQKSSLGARSTTWKCNSSIRRPICRRLLKKYKVDVVASLQFFVNHGGYCDCEVIFNVERSFKRASGRRRERIRVARVAAVQIGNGNRMVVKVRRRRAKKTGSR